MSNGKTILLLIISVILVSLLSNKSSAPFFEFEGKGIINQYTALALGSTLHEPSQNNTDIRSITSPINQTNRSSSDLSTLVNKGHALYNQGNYTQAIQYYDKALDIDADYEAALYGKGNALISLGDASNKSRLTKTSGDEGGYNRGAIDAQNDIRFALIEI